MDNAQVKKPFWKKRWFLWPLGLLVLIVFALLIGLWRLNQPLPVGEKGPAAEAMANAFMEAINHQAWEQTGAVAWDFDGRQQHLWDRKRQFARVSWGQTEVLVNLRTQTGLAFREGRPVTGDEAGNLVRRAWAHWANDSFWLNPVSKLFDEGTERSRVVLENGAVGLLVTYRSGGVTPGDSYLWFPGEDGRPNAWQMWVGILPIGGLKATWEDWFQAETGVWLARNHKILGLRLELRDIRCAGSLQELTQGEDPFLGLQVQP